MNLVGGESAPGADEVVLAVHVVTTDGAYTEHGYPLPNDESADAASPVEGIVRDVLNAISGRIPILALDNPNVIYKSEHIVRVAYDITI